MTPMTEDELVADLSRLLREGLVMVETDVYGIDDPDNVPRFRLTAHGLEEVEAGADLYFENATSEPVGVHNS